MTHAEFQDWFELYKIEPWGEKQICSTIAIGTATIGSAFAKNGIDPNDCLPVWQENVVQGTAKDFKAWLDMRKNGVK